MVCWVGPTKDQLETSEIDTALLSLYQLLYFASGRHLVTSVHSLVSLACPGGADQGLFEVEKPDIALPEPRSGSLCTIDLV
jgi:hypothetical protein